MPYGDVRNSLVLIIIINNLSKQHGLHSEPSPLFVKKTSNFEQNFERFEKIKIDGLHFASISHPQNQPFYNKKAKIIL